MIPPVLVEGCPGELVAVLPAVLRAVLPAVLVPVPAGAGRAGLTVGTGSIPDPRTAVVGAVGVVAAGAAHAATAVELEPGPLVRARPAGARRERARRERWCGHDRGIAPSSFPVLGFSGPHRVQRSTQG